MITSLKSNCETKEELINFGRFIASEKYDQTL